VMYASTHVGWKVGSRSKRRGGSVALDRQAQPGVSRFDSLQDLLGDSGGFGGYEGRQLAGYRQRNPFAQQFASGVGSYVT